MLPDFAQFLAICMNVRRLSYVNYRPRETIYFMFIMYVCTVYVLCLRVCLCRKGVSRHVCLIYEARRIMRTLFISNFNVDL
jgi:hypothetical protein